MMSSALIEAWLSAELSGINGRGTSYRGLGLLVSEMRAQLRVGYCPTYAAHVSANAQPFFSKYSLDALASDSRAEFTSATACSMRRSS